MPGRLALAHVSLETVRWLLPLFAVLLVSATLAYAATSSASISLRATSITAADTPVDHAPDTCHAYAGAIGWLLDDLARGRECTQAQVTAVPR